MVRVVDNLSGCDGLRADKADDAAGGNWHDTGSTTSVVPVATFEGGVVIGSW